MSTSLSAPAVPRAVLPKRYTAAIPSSDATAARTWSATSVCMPGLYGPRSGRVGECLAGGGDRAIDVALGVRRGQEPGFVLRRGQVDAPRQHGAMEPAETRGVGLRRGGVVGHRTRGEERRDHRADTVHLE